MGRYLKVAREAIEEYRCGGGTETKDSSPTNEVNGSVREKKTPDVQDGLTSEINVKNQSEEKLDENFAKNFDEARILQIEETIRQNHSPPESINWYNGEMMIGFGWFSELGFEPTAEEVDEADRRRAGAEAERRRAKKVSSGFARRAE